VLGKPRLRVRVSGLTGLDLFMRVAESGQASYSSRDPESWAGSPPRPFRTKTVACDTGEGEITAIPPMPSGVRAFSSN